MLRLAQPTDATPLPSPAVRWGVHLKSPVEQRRILRVCAGLYLVAGVGIIQLYVTGRRTTAPPRSLLASGVVCLLCAAAVLVFAAVRRDRSIERGFPGLVLALLFGAAAAVPTVLHIVGLRERGHAGSSVYVLPLILGFYLLARWLAVTLLASIAVGHAILLSVSEPLVDPFSHYVFLLTILTCAGVLIGGLVDRIDQSARAEERARIELARVNEDLERRVRAQAEELAAAVAARLDDVRASRVRLVQVADATRRQVERDLHDGAQQRLVTVALRLRNLRGDLTSVLQAAGVEAPELTEELEDISEELDAGLRELRELARGMYPSALAGGLGVAVRELVARTGREVVAETDLDRRLPAVVELTAYFVIAEGLANAAKHAAGPVRVRVLDLGDELAVDITDRGPGCADPSGGGLAGLRDRVEAVGGDFQVLSAAGSGTTVVARLPTEDVAAGAPAPP